MTVRLSSDLSSPFPSFFTHSPETSPTHVGTFKIEIFQLLYTSGTVQYYRPEQFQPIKLVPFALSVTYLISMVFKRHLE